MRYLNGTYNAAEGTRNAFGELSADLVSEGHPEMRSVSGDREHHEQVAIFVDRYDQQATGNGPFGDVRWWNGDADGYPGGDRWVRYSPAGTVAVPGSGNHEARRSNDLAYPYSDASTAAHRRARELAPAYGITCEGMNFGEMWHWTFWGALGAIGTPAAVTAKPLQQDSSDEEMTNMEAYVSVPSGAVVHFVPGGQHVFKSQQEYETFAKEVEFIRARAGIDVMPVPPLSKVVGVSWATYERLQANFGAPADGSVDVPPVDVEALAAQLAGKLGIDVTAVRAAVRAELATLTLKAG